MSYFTSFDGTKNFYEERGSGPAIVFAHEFGGDWRSWNAQVDHFQSEYRCVRYCARGFLPSEVPEDKGCYGQQASSGDLLALADFLDLDRFHLVGLSMGSFTGLLFSIEHSHRLDSLTLAGCSSGPSEEAQRVRYRDDLKIEIGLLDRGRGDGAVSWFSDDKAYQRMSMKRPDTWRTYCDNLRAQSVLGAKNTLSTLHWDRVSIYEREKVLRQMSVSTLLIFGDEDHPLIEPTNLFLASTLPNAHVRRLPKTGHLVNIEDPALFNDALDRHLIEATANG